MTETTPYRAEYVEALTLLAKASAAVRAAGHSAPILVGGAVVEFDTCSQIVSGDFDFVSTDDEPFAQALVKLGFEQGDGRSRRRQTFVHPKLAMGVDLVSGAYFDGRGDRSRVRLVQVAGSTISMASTEDLIADRLGQWIASDRRDHHLLHQAIALFRLADDLDASYLDRRIREDTSGDLSLKSLQELNDEEADLGRTRPPDPGQA